MKSIQVRRWPLRTACYAAGLALLLMVVQQVFFFEKAEALSLEIGRSSDSKASTTSTASREEASARTSSSLELNLDIPLLDVEVSTPSLRIDGLQVELSSTPSDIPGTNEKNSSVEESSGNIRIELFKDSDLAIPIQVQLPDIEADLQKGRVEVSPAKVNSPVVNVETGNVKLDAQEAEVALPALKVEVPIKEIGNRVEDIQDEATLLSPSQPISQESGEARDEALIQVESTGTTQATKETVPVQNKQIPGLPSSSVHQESDDQLDVMSLIPAEHASVPETPAIPLEEDQASKTWNNDDVLNRTGQSPDSLSAVIGHSDPSENSRSNDSTPNPSRDRDYPLIYGLIMPANSSGSGGASSAGSTSSGGMASGIAGMLPYYALTSYKGNPIYIFYWEHRFGVNQWSQPPPGQPPQYTSFSNWTSL